MAPCTITFDGQTIKSLIDDEKCSLSDTDLFDSLKIKNKNVQVKNSKFYLPNYDSDLMQGILSTGTQYFAQSVLEALDAYIKKDSVVVDIGANIGNFTLYWANEAKVKKIYAFEPIHYLFKILEINTKINKIEDKVVLNNCGLADKICGGEIKYFSDADLNDVKLKVLQSDTKFVIPLKTLDSCNIKERNIDLIKIFVKGMEKEVLLGATKTIKKHKPAIAIESFDNNYNDTNAILKRMGYKLETDFGSNIYLYTYKG